VVNVEASACGGLEVDSLATRSYEEAPWGLRLLAFAVAGAFEVAERLVVAGLRYDDINIAERPLSEGSVVEGDSQSLCYDERD